MVLTIVVLTIGLLLIYPLNQAHVFGAGNDEADGMNIAVTNLLHGRYPYIGHTWAGNPIVPWPGSVFLATPFVLLGNSAYQVIFWLALLYVTITWYMGRGAAAALTLIWSIIGFSPVFLDYFWSGSDVVAAAMFVTTAALVTVKSARANSRWHLLAAAGLGVAFSSRANFVLAYPAVAAALYGARGLRPAIVSGLVTGGCFVAVTMPFLFADFADFTPLTSRTTILLALSPGAPAVIVAVSVATIISVLVLGRFWDWLVSASLMLAVPVVAVVALALRAHGAIGLNSYPDYGITYEFFGVVVAGRLVLDGAMAHFSPTSTSVRGNNRAGTHDA